MKITNFMKKSLTSALILAAFAFMSCSSTKGLQSGTAQKKQVPNVHSDFNILHVNDTHGYIETTADNNLALIASYMDTYSVAESLRVSNGDMFQGTGVSNLTKGRVILEAMNALEFDCMVVGNHEFDWGIETILSYFDGDKSNGEANFPLLAANIVDKNGKPIKYAKPYMIKEINGARIGVIGIIGDTLESSISVKSLAGHEFTDAHEAAEKYVKILRENEGCNMVIIATHCGPESNVAYEGLAVDLILNSHTHRVEDYPHGYTSADGKIKTTIPCIQSGSYSRAVGKVDTTVDYKTVTINSMENWCVKKFGSWATHIIEGLEPSAKIEKIYADYMESLEPVLNNPICTSTNGKRGNIARYTTSFLKESYKADAAFVNGGGFRTDWADNTVVTYSKLLEMIPFENEMKTCRFTGKGVKVLADALLNGLNGKSVDIVTNSSFTVEGDNYYLDGVLIEDEKEYYFAVLDYVFDKSTYKTIFENAYDVQLTNATLRDLLQECLKKSGSNVVDFLSY